MYSKARRAASAFSPRLPKISVRALWRDRSHHRITRRCFWYDFCAFVAR
jgi:hypothetical protein